MRTLLITLTLLCSSAVMANGNPVQQGPLSMDIPMQSMPQQDDNGISPAMLRMLMQQAEQQAAQEAAQAREDTSNARINNTQRQQ